MPLSVQGGGLKGRLIQRWDTISGAPLKIDEGLVEGETIRLKVDPKVPTKRSNLHFDFYVGDLKKALLDMPSRLPNTDYLEALSPLSGHLGKSAFNGFGTSHSGLQIPRSSRRFTAMTIKM